MNKKILIGLFVGVLILLPLILILFSTPRQAPQSSSIPALPTSVVSATITPYANTGNASSITPLPNTVLTPGKIYTFIIDFTSPLPNNVSSGIIQSSLETTDTRLIDSDMSLSEDNRKLTIRIRTVVAPSSSYTLIVSQESKTIFSTQYLSDRIQITPVQSNNPELKSYLPYETSTYILSFNEKRNVYIFNLKIDESSDQNLEAQYQKAKSEAESFIQSKNIDSSTVIIEWRRS